MVASLTTVVIFAASLFSQNACGISSGNVVGPTITEGNTTYSCKCIPGDQCWPDTAKWAALNETVGGALLKVVPPSAVCHNTFDGQATYNAADCQDVTNNWGNETWQ
jgi:hypothetical protein